MITTKRGLTTPITILPFLATSLVSVNQEQHLGNVRRKGVRPRQSADRSSCCPQGATALVGPIAVVNIALPPRLHGQRRTVCALRREQHSAHGSSSAQRRAPRSRTVGTARSAGPGRSGRPPRRQRMPNGYYPAESCARASRADSAVCAEASSSDPLPGRKWPVVIGSAAFSAIMLARLSESAQFFHHTGMEKRTIRHRALSLPTSVHPHVRRNPNPHALGVCSPAHSRPGPPWQPGSNPRPHHS